MSPYEIVYPGGSVEHWNDVPGSQWMQRILDTYSRAVWLNPVRKKYWEGTPSIQLLSELMGGQMFPLNLDGLDRAIRCLTR